MTIRVATSNDFAAIWAIFSQVVGAGDTYAYRTDTTEEQARRIWLEEPRETFVYEIDNRVLGTYFLKTNQQGPGDHVCNCGYMVSSSARGQGVASAMCEHSQQVARDLGYQAMQFNFVVASNVGAIRLWQRHGFDTVGRVPKAFKHPALGLVDALIMYKWLG